MLYSVLVGVPSRWYKRHTVGATGQVIRYLEGLSAESLMEPAWSRLNERRETLTTSHPPFPLRPHGMQRVCPGLLQRRPTAILLQHRRHTSRTGAWISRSWALNMKLSSTFRSARLTPGGKQPRVYVPPAMIWVVRKAVRPSASEGTVRPARELRHWVEAVFAVIAEALCVSS